MLSTTLIQSFDSFSVECLHLPFQSKFIWLGILFYDYICIFYSSSPIFSSFVIFLCFEVHQKPSFSTVCEQNLCSAKCLMMFFSRVCTSELGAYVALRWEQFLSLWRARIKHNLTHLSLQFSLTFLLHTPPPSAVDSIPTTAWLECKTAVSEYGSFHQNPL